MAYSAPVAVIRTGRPAGDLALRIAGARYRAWFTASGSTRPYAHRRSCSSGRVGEHGPDISVDRRNRHGVRQALAPRMRRWATITALAFRHCRERATPTRPKRRRGPRSWPAHGVSPRLMSFLTCRRGRSATESIYLTVPIGNYCPFTGGTLPIARHRNLLSILFWHQVAMPDEHYLRRPQALRSRITSWS